MTTWTPETIREKLAADDRWVERATVAIYERQTASEQAVQETNEHNGRGYNGTDATLMSSFAEQIKRGRSLSPKQMVYARKKIMKYAGQLARIANGKEN